MRPHNAETIRLRPATSNRLHTSHWTCRCGKGSGYLACSQVTTVTTGKATALTQITWLARSAAAITTPRRSTEQVRNITIRHWRTSSGESGWRYRW
ncbi:hypothetical protein D3C80_1780940 [compost metagenome]